MKNRLACSLTLLMAGASLLVACGGGGDGASIEPPLPPAKPTVTIEGATKQLIFRWADVDGAAHYRLMENPDGHSGFSQVGDDIPAGTAIVSRDIAVHLFDWVNAQYIVEACNVTGCSSSDVVTGTDVMLDTIGYFKASNTDYSDRFGTSVALSADGYTLAVGASGEASATAGINGDESDNRIPAAGAVYLFRFDGTNWQQQAYIKASTNWFWGFGGRVALSSDGNTLAAYGRDELGGAIFVFHYNGVAWYQEAEMQPSNIDYRDRFGWSIAISGDGDTLAVGAPRESSGGRGVNGDQNGVSDWSGAVYVYRRDASVWTQHTFIKASDASSLDGFGQSVALSADGNTLAVGAQDEDCHYEPHMWYACQDGALYVFRFDGEDWFEQARIDESDEVGHSVALSADGNTIAIAGVGNTDYEPEPEPGDPCYEDYDLCDWGGFAGAIHLFRFKNSVWTRESYVEISNRGTNDRFPSRLWTSGLSLSADGNILAAAAHQDSSNAAGINGDPNDDSEENSGAVYVFQFGGTDWYQRAYIKASNTDAADQFGVGVSLSADGSTLAVGAYTEDSGAVGISGNQDDNSARNAGAVYIY